MNEEREREIPGRPEGDRTTGTPATGTEPHGGAVLVTGISSGIGEAIAVHLAHQGYPVFGTVRREADRRRLEALGLPTLRVLCPVDLTREAEIRAAVGRLAGELEASGLTLRAVVNNAGAGGPAPIELLPTGVMATELAARVTGPISLLQQTLPLLRAGYGRILWITTPAIIPTPYVASIHACDFAANCLARTLEIELRPWALPVVMIRCGGVRTPAGLRTVGDIERLLESAPPDRVGLYESRLRRWADEMEEFDRRRVEAQLVAQTVERAIAASRPRRRYSVGHMARLAALLEALPQPLADWILARRFA